MARLFWVATGSALTVVVLVKARAAAKRYAPAALVDRATATAQATGASLQDVASHVLSDFRAARDARATQLADALLAPTQGSPEELRAQRDQTRSQMAARSGARHRDGLNDPETFDPATLDDADDGELGYSF